MQRGTVCSASHPTLQLKRPHRFGITCEGRRHRRLPSFLTDCRGSYATVIHEVTIWTDGSCLGNPGPGGWAYIIAIGEERTEGSGHSVETTNNRMEMTAAIEALRTLPASRRVVLHSDSQLLIKTMTLGWKRKKNQDLWDELDRLAAFHHIDWQWVRGHNGHPENETCDTLAQRAASVASSLRGSPREV